MDEIKNEERILRALQAFLYRVSPEMREEMIEALFAPETHKGRVLVPGLCVLNGMHARQNRLPLYIFKFSPAYACPRGQ